MKTPINVSTGSIIEFNANGVLTTGVVQSSARGGIIGPNVVVKVGSHIPLDEILTIEGISGGVRSLDDRGFDKLVVLAIPISHVDAATIGR